ncbi:MAG: SGNH/GDSL hydrolase family protein [Pseudomonadota bacterium]
MFERRPKTTLTAFLLIIFILLEVQFRLLAHFGAFPYQHYETRNLSDGLPTFLDDINPDFGVWHYPNASGRHTSPCYDVAYHSNSRGMVDRERTLKMSGAGRVVVLGDSFVEGFGVETEKRFTDILEQATGVEHLNFGSSGSFGPLQEWLLYRTLASRFEHTDVFLFFLPFNDFFDLDPGNFPPDRYRPYLKKSPVGFEVYYPVKFEDRRRERLPWLKNLRNILSNRLYLINFLRFSARWIKEKFSGKDADESSVPVPYDNFSAEELERVLHCYGLIAKAASPGRLFIFSIPTARDLVAQKSRGTAFPLVTAMEDFAAARSNVFFFDLAPLLVKELTDRNLSEKELELPCDHHWNALGHEIAAEAIKKIFPDVDKYPRLD